MNFIGTLANQIPTNAMLGRFAFLDKIPPDVLLQITSSNLSFTGTTTVPTISIGDVSQNVVNAAFLDTRINTAKTLAMTDNTTVDIATTVSAYSTIVLTGALTLGNTLLFAKGVKGVWNIVSTATLATTAPANTVLGVDNGSTAVAGKTVVIPPSGSARVYSDGTNVYAVGATAAQAITPWKFTATAGQTVFSMTYTPNMVFGVAGGAFLTAGVDFDASTGTSITMLTLTPAAGDQYVFYAFNGFTVANALTLNGGTMIGALNLATGSTAVTQAVGTNNTTIATMAALQTGILTIQKSIAATSTIATLTAAQVGTVLLCAAAAGTAVTLPGATTVAAGGWYEVVNSSNGGVVTVTATSGGFGMYDASTGAAFTKIILRQNESVIFYTEPGGANIWRMKTGTGLAAGRLINIQTFLTAGTSTYTPTPGTKSIIVHATGAGGPGGGLVTASSSYRVSAPGTPGTYAIARYTSGFTTGVSVTVGAGGVGLSGDTTTWNSGGTTSFGALLTCPGGGSGASAYTTSATGVYTGPANGTVSAAATGSGILSQVSGLFQNYSFMNNGGIFTNIIALPPLISGFTGGQGGVGAAAGGGSASVGANGNAGAVIVYEFS